jgi:hypothetical protein
LLFWMLPRGLVTAVLALEIVNDRGAVFSFLPAMAFTVVLVTNLFIVWGAVRAARVAASRTGEAVVAPPDVAAVPVPDIGVVASQAAIASGPKVMAKAAGAGSESAR